MTESMPVRGGDAIDCDSGLPVRRRRRRFRDGQHALDALIRAMLTAYSAPSSQGAQSDRLLDGVVPNESRSKVVVVGMCDDCRKWTSDPVCACGGHVTFPTRALSIGSAPHVQTATGQRGLPRGYDDIGTLIGCWSSLTDFERQVLVLDVTVAPWLDRSRKCEACRHVYSPTDSRCPQCRKMMDPSHVRCTECRTPTELVWSGCPNCGSALWSKARGRATIIAERLTEYRVVARQAVTPYAIARCHVERGSVSGFVTSARKRWERALMDKGLIA